MSSYSPLAAVADEERVGVVSPVGGVCELAGDACFVQLGAPLQGGGERLLRLDCGVGTHGSGAKEQGV